MVIVPPGGFAGFSQMTPASQRSLFNSPARSGTRRRRKGKAKKARLRAKSGTRRSSKRKLKFGSPAWRKKYMK